MESTLQPPVPFTRLSRRRHVLNWMAGENLRIRGSFGLRATTDFGHHYIRFIRTKNAGSHYN